MIVGVAFFQVSLWCDLFARQTCRFEFSRELKTCRRDLAEVALHCADGLLFDDGAQAVHGGVEFMLEAVGGDAGVGRWRLRYRPVDSEVHGDAAFFAPGGL